MSSILIQRNSENSKNCTELNKELSTSKKKIQKQQRVQKTVPEKILRELVLAEYIKNRARTLHGTSNIE
jgi:hypothetical protein